MCVEHLLATPVLLAENIYVHLYMTLFLTWKSGWHISYWSCH